MDFTIFVMENLTDNNKKIDMQINNCSISNVDNTKNIEYGYDFTNNPGKLPGEICLEIFDSMSEFKKNKWYSKTEIYDLSCGVLENIWIDPDNPNNIVYVDYQSYDSPGVPRELQTIEIVEIIEYYESDEESNKDSDDESEEESNDESNDESNKKYNVESNNESDEEPDEESNEELSKENKEKVVEIGHMIYDSDFTFTELNDRFLYSKIFLGYDYKLYHSDLYYENIDILPYKDKIFSLKKLCIRRIRLYVAEKLDFVEEINNSKILLKPLTIINNSGLQWNPLLIQYLENLIKEQPLFIREILHLKSL